MEFTGSTIRNLSVEGRLTIANMAIEAGGKAGLFEVDDIARAWLDGRCERPYKEYHADGDCTYKQVVKIDAATVVPQVSWPHLPSNTHPVAESRDIKIDQAVIGSCTNGRIEDMRAAADVLRGRTVDPNVRCIVIPATQGVWLQCVHEGLMDVFIDAHCVVSTPTCGPCLGGYMGILAAGERKGDSIMKFKGTAFRYGRDVDTDVIIPARYLNTSDPAELAKHCLEDLDPTFVDRVKKGDIIVADENFGCGSSREHAPVAIKAAGVSVVIAKSFARIFYRNAIKCTWTRTPAS